MEDNFTVTYLPEKIVTLKDPILDVPERVLILNDYKCAVGDFVDVKSEKGNFTCAGKIKEVSTIKFAYLTNKDLADLSNINLRSWPNAYAYLQEKHPGFTQEDYVTLLTVVPFSVVEYTPSDISKEEE